MKKTLKCNSGSDEGNCKSRDVGGWGGMRDGSKGARRIAQVHEIAMRHTVGRNTLDFGVV